VTTKFHDFSTVSSVLYTRFFAARFMAQRYIVQRKCLNRQMETCPLRVRWYNF